MSTVKQFTPSALVFIVGLIIVVTQLLAPIGQADDDVVSYYLDRVEAAITARNPVLTGAVYSYTAKSLYKHTNSHGRISSVDSVEIVYFYSWGKLDSQRVITGDPKIFEDLTGSYPDIFAQGYLYQSFPHDTGGAELAIGLDTPDAEDHRPTGLLVIDRQRYNPRWLYLSYPDPSGHARLSRVWRFVEQDDLLFIDSSWAVGAKRGVFGFDHYRIETGITNITIEK